MDERSIRRVRDKAHQGQDSQAEGEYQKCKILDVPLHEVCVVQLSTHLRVSQD
jgi:hypothetical protein